MLPGGTHFHQSYILPNLEAAQLLNDMGYFLPRITKLVCEADCYKNEKLAVQIGNFEKLKGIFDVYVERHAINPGLATALWEFLQNPNLYFVDEFRADYKWTIDDTDRTNPVYSVTISSSDGRTPEFNGYLLQYIMTRYDIEGPWLFNYVDVSSDTKPGSLYTYSAGFMFISQEHTSYLPHGSWVEGELQKYNTIRRENYIKKTSST